MNRTVFCSRLNKEAEGLDSPVYPGEIGKRIFETVSKEAWLQWQCKQTMLINEKKLSMMNSAHRKLIEKAMEKFLLEGRDVDIEGYVPL